MTRRLRQIQGAVGDAALVFAQKTVAEPDSDRKPIREPVRERACSSPLAVLAEADACHMASCRFNVAEDLDGHRCALLYAERDGMTLDEIGALLGVSRERVRQIEAGALAGKPVQALIRRLKIAPDDFATAELD